jgi:hypothetical protein
MMPTNYKLEKDQQKSLKLLDKWLIDNMHTNSGMGGEELVMEVRETITKIEERGYYTDVERELLNEIRSQYMNK